MKRLLAIAFVTSVSLVACGKKKAPEPAKAGSGSAAAEPAKQAEPTKPDEGGW
jgi:hypothetical protein